MFHIEQFLPLNVPRVLRLSYRVLYRPARKLDQCEQIMQHTRPKIIKIYLFVCYTTYCSLTNLQRQGLGRVQPEQRTIIGVVLDPVRLGAKGLIQIKQQRAAVAPLELARSRSPQEFVESSSFFWLKSIKLLSYLLLCKRVHPIT